jgi:hypothetical protein
MVELLLAIYRVQRHRASKLFCIPLILITLMRLRQYREVGESLQRWMANRLDNPMPLQRNNNAQS